MTRPLTHTEENYLKAIYKANEKTKTAVNTNTIAAYMNTSAASVTDMIKKLALKELVIYERYKGARLSPTGSKTATSVIRKHRLWETFLVQKLGFSWEEVHEIAEELEHINSDKLISKLDEYLGFPKYDPHGDPIPSADGKFMLREQMILSQLNIDETGILVGVKNHETSFLSHLNNLNIALGSAIRIIARSEFDKSLKVSVSEGAEVVLTDMVAKNLLIRKT